MRSYLVGSYINGLMGIHSCPLCGYYTFVPEEWEEHFKQRHTLPGDNWQVTVFTLPTNPNHRVWIVHNEPIV